MAAHTVGRAVLRQSCCRASVYRPVAAIGAIHTQLPSRIRRDPRGPPGSNHRYHSTSPIRFQDKVAVHRTQVETTDRSANKELGLDSPEGVDDASDLPWYLQPQSQEPLRRDTPSHLVDRQRLPDLPPQAPPILQTLLQHVSIDIGLDDLTLLDLRDVDPPSALGSNLLMLVGTARSEKHLHVSADRFCRYLRATHKLRAHADGLLGRGELKIRLRRMAKRARIMANVGAVNTARSIDNIRTGWICVIVDGIEPDPAWESSSMRTGITGFDERSDKVTLVVQIFTEAKREEIDIEKLWTGRSLRSSQISEADGTHDEVHDTGKPAEVMQDMPDPVLGRPELSTG